jgi:hypothetical protein
MAHIIPNEQHSKRVLYPIALTRYKEKQFTGCPAKVQLSAEVIIHFVDFGARTAKETRSRHGRATFASGVAAALRSWSEKQAKISARRLRLGLVSTLAFSLRLTLALTL